MRLLRFCSWFMVVALVSACAGLPTNSPTPAETPTAISAPTSSEPGDTSGTVTIGFAAPDFERSSYEPLIEAFNRENPGIHVEFVSINEATGSSTSINVEEILRQTVSAADTASPFFVRPEDLTSGLLLDLKPFIEADPEFDGADYYPGSFDQGTGDGSIYLLPRTLEVPLLSYNKQLWAEAGLEPPSPDWSWTDLIAAAEQLVKKRGDEIDTYGFVSFDGARNAFIAALGEAGVEMTLQDSGTPQIDRPEIAAALERTVELVNSGAFYTQQEQGNAVGFGDFQELITNGQAGIWPSGLQVVRPGQPEATLDTGSVPFPSPLPQTQFELRSQGYVISSGTEHPEEAWKWLSYLSRQEIKQPGGMVMIGGGIQLPARKSIAELTGFWNNRDDEEKAAIEAALARPRMGVQPNQDAVGEALRKALEAVFNGTPADQALADAQAELGQAIAEAVTPTPGAPVTVATPAPSGPPAGATQVSFASLGMNPVQLRQLARQFSEQHPEIYIDVQQGFMEGPLNIAALAARYDCFTSSQQFDQSGVYTATLDLQPLIDADPAFNVDDYPAALLAPFKQDGATYGIPYAVTLRALSYNQDAFQAAGVEPPIADWTLDEFLQAAETLTTGDESDPDRTYGFASNGIQTDDLHFILDRLQAPLTTGSGEQLQPNYTDPKVEEAIQYYIDFLNNVTPHTRLNGYSSDEMFGAGEAIELIDSGRVGMWFEYGIQRMMIRIGGPDQPAYTTAIAPPPLVGENLTRNDMLVNGMYISKQSQNQQACWEWLKFLTNDVSLLGGDFPARASLASSDGFTQHAAPGAADVYQAYSAALDQVQPAINPSPAQIDYYWFYRAVDQALQGKNLQNELADAQSLTEQYLACVRGGEKPVSCATLVDPEYKGFAGMRG